MFYILLLCIFIYLFICQGLCRLTHAFFYKQTIVGGPCLFPFHISAQMKDGKSIWILTSWKKQELSKWGYCPFLKGSKELPQRKQVLYTKSNCLTNAPFFIGKDVAIVRKGFGYYSFMFWKDTFFSFLHLLRLKASQVIKTEEVQLFKV